MHDVSDLRITVRAEDRHWRSDINATAQSAADPVGADSEQHKKSSEHSHRHKSSEEALEQLAQRSTERLS